MNKLIMVGFALLTVAACSEVEQEATVASAPVELQTASWDAVGTTFYTEMIPCVPGADFGGESVDAMITEWRGIGVSPDLLGSWTRTVMLMLGGSCSGLLKKLRTPDGLSGKLMKQLPLGLLRTRM